MSQIGSKSAGFNYFHEDKLSSEEDKSIEEPSSNSEENMQVETQDTGKNHLRKGQFNDQTSKCAYYIMPLFNENQIASSVKNVFQKQIECMTALVKKNKSESSLLKVNQQIQEFSELILLAFENLIRKLDKVTTEAYNLVSHGSKITKLINQLQSFKRVLPNQNLNVFLSAFAFYNKTQSTILIEITQQPTLPLSPVLLSIYCSIFQQNVIKNSNINLDEFIDNPYTEDGYLSRYAVINLGNPSPFDLLFCKLLPDHLLYIAFPNFLSESGEWLTEQIMNAGPHDNALLLPLYMNEFVIDQPPQYPSHLIDFALTDTLIDKIAEFLPSTIVIVHYVSTPLEEQHFARMLQHLHNRIKCKIVLHCALKNQQLSSYAMQQENYMQDSYGKHGISTALMEVQQENRQNQYYNIADQSWHCLLNKVKIFTQIFVDKLEINKIYDSVESYKYAQIYPHLALVAENMQHYFPQLRNLFQDLSLKMRTKSIQRNLQKYREKLNDCVPIYFKNIVNKLPTFYDEDEIDEYVTCLSIRFSSRRFTHFLQIIQKNPTQTLNVQVKPIKLFQDLQILYNKQAASNIFPIFILNDFSSHEVPMNYGGYVNKNTPRQSIELFQINISPIVEDNIIRCKWHFHQTSNYTILFWPTHLNYELINPTPIISSQIYVTPSNGREKIHFNRICHSLNTLYRPLASSYSHADQLLIFSGSHVHTIDMTQPTTMSTTPLSQSLSAPMHFLTAQHTFLFGGNTLTTHHYYQLNYHLDNNHIIPSTITLQPLTLPSPLPLNTNQTDYHLTDNTLHWNPTLPQPLPNHHHQKEYRQYGQATGALIRQTTQLTIHLLPQHKNYITVVHNNISTKCMLMYNNKPIADSRIKSLAHIDNHLYVLMRHRIHTEGRTVLMYGKATAQSPTLSITPMHTFDKSHPCYLMALKHTEIAVMHCFAHSSAADQIIRVNGPHFQPRERQYIQNKAKLDNVFCWINKENQFVTQYAIQCVDKAYFMHCQRIVLSEKHKRWRNEGIKKEISIIKEGINIEEGTIENINIFNQDILLTMKINQELWEGKLDSSNIIDLVPRNNLLSDYKFMSCSNQSEY